MEHYPVKVDALEGGSELWRCAVCGEEHVIATSVEDKEAFFNTQSACIGYNPAPG